MRRVQTVVTVGGSRLEAIPRAGPVGAVAMSRVAALGKPNGRVSPGCWDMRAGA